MATFANSELDYRGDITYVPTDAHIVLTLDHVPTKSAMTAFKKRNPSYIIRALENSRRVEITAKSLLNINRRLTF